MAGKVVSSECPGDTVMAVMKREDGAVEQAPHNADQQQQCFSLVLVLVAGSGSCDRNVHRSLTVWQERESIKSLCCENQQVCEWPSAVCVHWRVA